MHHGKTARANYDVSCVPAAQKEERSDRNRSPNESMPVTGALFKSGSKGGAGNGNIAGILADFLDDAGKLKATRRRLFLGGGRL
jgi:hypothetical protein